ncbi:tail fiber domain-containing protein [Spirosoma jeollabukense]
MEQSILNGKKLALLLLLIVTASNLEAQVRIGPSAGSIDGSVSLDVSSGPYASGSPFRGLLVPSVTTTQRGQIQNPVKGLLIFNTSTNQIEVNTGTPAAPIWTAGGASSSGGNSGWSLTGNAGTTSANFLGTTDNAPLRFKVNNQNAGWIDPTLYNIGLGYLALNPAATGQGNTAIGTFALAGSTTSNFNTAVGFQALNSNATGSFNTAMGTVALLANTTGQFNVASGYKALFKNIDGSGNTAIGSVALQENTSGHDNTALGTNTLNANTTGNFNTAAGAGALQKNTLGFGNTAVGHNAVAANTTGYSNVGLGEDALIVNVDGHDNTALGANSLSANTTGYYNTAAGAGALQKNVSGYSNIAIGHNSTLVNTTGYSNVGVGENALGANIDGHDNTALGNASLLNNTSGSNNTASGLVALRYNTTGSRNTALGFDAGPSAASPNLTNSTAIGANAVVSTSNTIVLGDNTITSLRCNVQSISALSDKRIKEDIKADVPGLGFITRLTPVTYHVNKTKEAQLVGYPLINISEDKVLHSGFLAQDVEAAAQAVGYDFEGVRREEGGKYYTVGYTLFVIPLVQAVKDLNAEVNQLKAELAAVKEKEQANQARLDKLEALIQDTTRSTSVTFHPELSADKTSDPNRQKIK